MNPADLTDADIRLLLQHRATVAASEMQDPSSPESQAFLASILTADPAEIRKKLASTG